jgi:hypothetical protein
MCHVNGNHIIDINHIPLKHKNNFYFYVTLTNISPNTLKLPLYQFIKSLKKKKKRFKVYPQYSKVHDSILLRL